MLNFYTLYNGNGLDNEHYGPLIAQLMISGDITDKLRPIEHLIKKNPNYAFWYAVHVIKGRWPDAEPFIMKSAYDIFWYAKKVIK